MTDSTRPTSHPYRDPAPKEQETRKIFPRALRAFAVAGALFAGFESIDSINKIESELKNNEHYSEIQILGEVKTDIADAKSALDHSPLLVIPGCNGEGSCVIFVSPEIRPDIGRARSILERARGRVKANGAVSDQLRHISGSLPDAATTSEDIERCREVVTELDSAGAKVDSEVLRAQNSMNSGTEILVAKKQAYSAGAITSLFLLFALAFPALRQRKEEEPNKDAA